MSNQSVKNWAETIDLNISPSENFYQPTTIAELETALGAVLTDGKPNGKTLRFINSGHAWSPGIVPGDQPYPLPTSSVPVPTLTITDAVLIDVTGLSNMNADADPYLTAKVIGCNRAIPGYLVRAVESESR